MGPLEVLAQSKFIRVCQIWSTLSSFDRISLVRTQNRSLFVLLDSLFAKDVFVKKFIIFFNRLTNRFDWFIRAIHIQHCFFFLGDFGEHSSLFRSYLPHADLEWCTVFFWSPYSSGNILSKFHNFPQLDGLVGIWFNWLVVPACVERCFFVILKPKSYMVRAHKLQLDHG